MALFARTARGAGPDYRWVLPYSAVLAPILRRFCRRAQPEIVSYRLSATDCYLSAFLMHVSDFAPLRDIADMDQRC